jgi:hypothetical protein
VECFEEIKFGTLDVSLALKWVSIYYGNTFVVSNDLRIIHFCFKTPTIARVEKDFNEISSICFFFH